MIRGSFYFDQKIFSENNILKVEFAFIIRLD